MAPEADRLLVENLAVAPACQGRGLGPRLLAHAEALAVATGCRAVRLYTNKMMAANVALYLRLGYAIDREERLGDSTVVHMSKRVGG